jgi:hypothetical protein
MRFFWLNSILLYALSFSSNAQPDYYGMLSGGYGVFQHVLPQDGASGVLRFSLGAQVPIQKNLNIGMEISTQTGNRMRINTENAIPAVGTAPVFLTVKPILDALATVTYNLDESSIFFEVKGGAFYSDGMVDSRTIPNKSQISPEIVGGLGIHVTSMVNIVVYYQHIFSGQATLANIDVLSGTANLSQLPTLQTGFIGLEMHF